MSINNNYDNHNDSEDSWNKTFDCLRAIQTGKSIENESIGVVAGHLREVLELLEDLMAKHDAEVWGKSVNVGEEITTGDVEKKMKHELDLLNSRWIKYLESNNERFDATLFNMDGFYPCYASQKQKILFIGREACWMSQKNYIETLFPYLKKGKVGECSVDQYPFHKRQFYLAYGILSLAVGVKHRFPDWNEVPWASDLACILFARTKRNEQAYEKAMIKPMDGLQGISWAFMNLSKLSNDTGDWRTDDRRYRPFVEDETNRKFIRNEIRILRPDIIIGSSVYDLVEMLNYKRVDRMSTSYCDYYESETQTWPPFINCYHFSAIKKDKECYYDAVGNIFQKIVDANMLIKFNWSNNKQLELEEVKVDGDTK